MIQQGEELRSRRETVLKVIYLLFNESYASSNTDTLFKRDLCGEAMRLGELISDHSIASHADAKALVGFMCLLAARFDSRFSTTGPMVLFEIQDRSKWNKDILYIGNKYMFDAVKTEAYSKYHYEAAIQTAYMKADVFENTNWDKILNWYAQLSKIDSSPIIKLNMGIVYIYKGDLDKADSILTRVKNEAFGRRKYFVLSALAKLHQETNELDKALDCLLEAHKLATNTTKKELIE